MAYKDLAKKTAYRKAYEQKHRKQRLEWIRLNRIANPDRYKQYAHAANLARRGLTQDSWNSLFKSQNNCCAICLISTPGTKGWVVDHCHETDKVRGILCTKCNTTLGHLGDTIIKAPKELEKLLVYLAKAKQTKLATDLIDEHY